MEERRGLTIKDLLIRLILIIIFIFLLIWLFPMPDLKPLNNQIFADNVDRMKDVAKSYYTLERLPKDINSSKKMTLKEMIDNKLILPLMDSNGKYCSEDDSYIEITKLENEYIIKVYLSCSDKQDYIIEHYGCYDICSDTCKMLETTAKSGFAGESTTKKTGKVTTTKNSGKIYEYQFVKNVCTEKFDKYVCPSGYYSAGDSCIKVGSKVVTNPAEKKIVNVSKIDSKDAEPVIDKTTELKPAECSTQYKTSTIDAGYKKTTYKPKETITTQKITADKIYTYDVKGAVATTTTTKSDYIKVQNYDVIDADLVADGYKWSYVSTLTSREAGLQFENDNEKLMLVDTWQELTCDTCATTVTVYRYYRYKKVSTGTHYSCDAYASKGYVPYGTSKCRKPTNITTKCPEGFHDNGSGCISNTPKTTYSCSKYGAGYTLDEAKKTCTKTNTSYKCPSGSTATSDPQYCTKKITKYSCTVGTLTSDNKCVDYHDYFCPSNTSTKTYTLNGTKCTVKTKVKVCSCKKYPGSVQTDDKLNCVVTNSKTRYSCDKYPGYELKGNKCTKTIVTQQTTYSCDKYPGSVLDGTNCVKTVCDSDIKKAEKSYKTSCEQKYKWSTNTSISGWTYTGNKRQVN